MHMSNLAELVSDLAPEDGVSRNCRTHSIGRFRSYEVLALCCTVLKTEITATYSDQVSNVGLSGCQPLAIYKVRRLKKRRNLPESRLLTCLFTEQCEYFSSPEERPFRLRVLQYLLYTLHNLFTESEIVVRC